MPLEDPHQLPLSLGIPLEAYRSPTLLDRLRGRDHRFNAFARAKNMVLLGRCSVHEIRDIESKYGVNLAEQYRSEWDSLFIEICHHFLTLHHRLDTSHKAFLREYAKCFGLEQRADNLANVAAKRVFFEKVREVIADGESDDQKLLMIRELASTLGVSAETASSTYNDVCGRMLSDEVNRLIAESGMISDQDWERVESLANALRVSVRFSPESKSRIEECRHRWQIVHGALSEVQITEVHLKRRERCYFKGQAEWYESRKVTRRYDYAGLTGRIRIVKGLNLRMGSVAVRPVADESLHLIGSGQLFLTNRRIILLASTGMSKEMSWRDILAVNIQDWNQFELERGKGKSPTIRVTHGITDQAEFSSLLAGRLLRESS